MSLYWREWGPTGDYAAALLGSLDAPRAAALVWYLRELEIVGDGVRGMTVLELEHAVSTARYGYRVSWDELVTLLRGAEDIHDLLATAHTREVEVAFDPALQRYEGCVAVIEVLDSGPLWIGSKPPASRR